MTIKSLPSPCHVQWSAKRKDDENFTPIDINTEEYKGTTISFPHPVLAVRQKDQLEKKLFPNNSYKLHWKNCTGDFR